MGCNNTLPEERFLHYITDKGDYWIPQPGVPSCKKKKCPAHKILHYHLIVDGALPGDWHITQSQGGLNFLTTGNSYPEENEQWVCIKKRCGQLIKHTHVTMKGQLPDTWIITTFEGVNFLTYPVFDLS